MKIKIFIVAFATMLFCHLALPQGAKCGQSSVTVASTNHDNCLILYPTQRVFPVKHHIIRRSDGTGGMNPLLVDQVMANLNSSFSGAKIKFNECQSVISYIDENFLYDIQNLGDRL